MNTTNTALQRKQDFPAMLQQFKGEIARALPKHLDPDRMARIALTEFRKNPRLGQCSPRSVFASVIMASQVGLEPGLTGQAHLVPYGQECTFIPGYQGLIELVRRTGKVKRIEAHVVHERDTFEYSTGLQTILRHVPYFGDEDPGAARLAYAVAEFTDGGYHVEVMSRKDIETIKSRVASVRSGRDTPWNTDADEMWRKTVIRRICKYLPKSAELSLAVALDDAAMSGRQRVDLTDAIDGTWAPVLDDTDAATPEDDPAAALRDKVRQKLKRPATPPAVQTPPTTEMAPGSASSGLASLPPVALKEGETKFVPEFRDGEDD